MAGLSSPGVGSGLDINGLITKLMDVEKQPLTVLATKEADYQAKLSAYGTLKGAMSSLQTSVRGLASPSAFNAFKASASDATVLSASASSIAKAASYSVEVLSLAQVHKLSSSAQTDPTSAIGTGTLTIDFGTYDSIGNNFSVNAKKTAKTITIGENDSSLNGIRDAINNANAGVSASIVNDGSGYRLVISGNEAGTENSLRIKVDEGAGGTNTDTNGLSQLAYDPVVIAPALGKNLTQTQAVASASVKVDGLLITKPTNTISDAIQGVTFNLLKSNIGTPATLTVARDTSGVKASVEGFVKSYNDLAAVIQNLGGYDVKTQKGGLLLGDTTLRSVQAQMRSLISQRLSDTGSGLNSISEAGISFQRNGTLAIDSAKLNSVLADPTKNVGSLFATSGSTTDSLVSYAGSTSYTKSGTYGLVLSQIGTRGTVVGQSAVVGTIPITPSNNQLTLSVDGTSATVTLNAGDYTAETLAAEVQARINSDTTLAALGKQISVTQSGGILTLASNRYGSTSSVVVSGGTAASPLFGSTVSTTGVDVAGTIGGIGAIGSGQLLTATGDASGLQLLISGGTADPAGTSRGTVSFSFGIAYQLDKALEKILASGGSLAGRTDGINTSIKDIGSQREILSRRLAGVEARYRKQFNALDSLVASMQQTSSYLTQQLASISNLNGSNR